MRHLLDYPPVDERARLTGGVVPLTILYLITVHSLSNQSLRVFLFLSFMLLIWLAMLHDTSGSATVDDMIGMLFVGWFFRALDYIVLTDTAKEFYKTEGGGEDKNREKDPWRMGVQTWSKAKWMWSASIWTNDRGINWSWEVKNIRPKVPVGYSVR
ncbi:hypothetical protein GP486_002815 [Trichoglossum hirsutum]|uniref:Uncharacterized protein n=1 Tax=Trichoglossum hirsutum TaxID=265104 RepID=A0A9P8LEH4_9PEZI|nr:hypothetical protein GP486_002815 [Trichoglossum hirsutum]